MLRNLKLSMVAVLFSTQVQSQFLSRLCTADSRSSLAVQQVDDDWNPVPFDCENTSVLIESDQFTRELLPAKYDYCPAIRYRNTAHLDRISGPVFVLNDNPGTYHVTITWYEQVSTFTNVVIPLDEDGCHAKQQILEVNFDMSKRVKK